MKSKNQTVPVSLELLAQACHAMDKRKAPNTFDEFQRMIKAGLAAANSPKAGEPGLDIDALEALALAVSPGHSWRVQHPNAGTRGWEVAGPDGLDQIAADMNEKRAAYVAAANPSAVLGLINCLRIAEQAAQTMIEKPEAGPLGYSHRSRRVTGRDVPWPDGIDKIAAKLLHEKPNVPKADRRGLEIEALEALARDARDIIKRALENHVLDNFCHGLKEDAQEFIESHDAAFKESSPKAPALPPIDPKLDNLQDN